ncbi:MAG: shikimate kinase [Eubacteriales bacterium]|nr:shikimate kinase [Eubacteriales bacterium]MDD4390749.1 shikimate kinase [Eubacteriales bacterium]
MRLGLLGERLGHSYSPMIYELMGLPGYEIFPMSKGKISSFLKEDRLRGINVTVPYKKTIMQFCDTLSQNAKKLANVNTLLFESDGSIRGYNTDYDGFVYMIKKSGFCLKGKKVIVLGTGGASQTVKFACLDAGARKVISVSRSGENNYGNILCHKDAEILVNATPVGMYPHEENTPISLEKFECLEGVADLIYNPLRTSLLTEATRLGIAAIGGLAMLIEQARKAAELFGGESIAEEETLRICRILQEKNENIVIIGMPGSGKTVIGAQIAKNMNRGFVDTDELLKERTRRSAAEWIDEYGEEVFREKEAEIVREAALGRGIVIATGGGAVLKEENRTALRRNGRVYWLRRPLEQLETEGRPLSENLPELFERRRPLYSQAADVAVDICDKIDISAKKIQEEFYAYISAQWTEY